MQSESPLANGILSGAYGRGSTIENGEAANVILTAEEVKSLDDALNRISMSDVFGGH